ncbi:Perforin-1 [Collichthys lucidus]|uniref:Perforin-1 n=1 Tax=Collichthys lucidus TaxID=240159 RepID=A0A4U5V8L2_COLLU|nr:Perforin-1 [Collichthys lucidus]
MVSSLPALLLVLCSLGVAQALLEVDSLRARGLIGDKTSPADCYVKLFYNSRSMGMTSFIVDNNNPWWDDTFAYSAAVQGGVLKVEAFDKDLMYDDELGSCSYALKRGTWDHECYLAKGGVLLFRYKLT